MSFDRPLVEMTDDEILAEVRAIRERRSRASAATVTKATRGRQAAKGAKAVPGGLTPEELALMASMMAAKSPADETPPRPVGDLDPEAGT